MFIGGRRNQGHAPPAVSRPPSGGPCRSLKTRDALYKHGPPGGGRARLGTASMNMALLPEGEALLAEGVHQLCKWNCT